MKAWLATVVLALGGGVAIAQCVQRAPLAQLPAAVLVPAPTTLVAPVLIPVAAFEFRWSPLAATGYTARDLPTPTVQPAPGTENPAPAFDSWPEATAAATVRPADPVATILRNQCARCHTFPGGKSGIQILDGNGSLWSSIDRTRVYRAVAAGRMPPGAPLGAREVELVRLWSRSK